MDRGLQLILPGEPVAKGRPRASMRGRRPVIYTPDATRKAEAKVAADAKRLLGAALPIVGPVIVRVDAYFPVRPSWTKRDRAARLGQPHTQKPDFDNVAKLYCDALNGIAYQDDAQIAGAFVQKMWCSEDEARVEVWVLPLDLGALSIASGDLVARAPVGLQELLR